MTIRKYIQNIISESIENIKAKEIEKLKNMLQTSWYKIQTKQNIDQNKAKFEYAEKVLTRKHNFTFEDFESTLEPMRYKIREEEHQREEQERARKKKAAMEFEQRKEREAAERAERWSQNERPFRARPPNKPNKPRTDMEVAMNTIHMQQQGYRWDDVYQRWIKDDY